MKLSLHVTVLIMECVLLKILNKIGCRLDYKAMLKKSCQAPDFVEFDISHLWIIR